MIVLLNVRTRSRMCWHALFLWANFHHECHFQDISHSSLTFQIYYSQVDGISQQFGQRYSQGASQSSQYSLPHGPLVYVALELYSSCHNICQSFILIMLHLYMLLQSIFMWINFSTVCTFGYIIIKIVLISMNCLFMLL